VFGAIAVWGEQRGVKQGLYESEDGLTCVNLYGTFSLRWDELLTFDHHRYEHGIVCMPTFGMVA
jgi:hypothetical protein